MKRNKIRILAVMMALCLCFLTACADSGTSGGTSASSYQSVSYTQVDSLSEGAKVAVTGTTDYNSTVSNENGNFFRLAGDGDWYVALGATSVSQLEKAVSSQKVTVYGTYVGKTVNGKPVVNIQAGEIEYGGKRAKTLDLVTGSAAGPSTGISVWIPTNGGTKYHSKSTCSGMKDPMRVDLSVARANGYTACKKCY